MRTIFCLFDSLNRAALGAYADSGIKTPNFDRFAARAQVFENHYVGSLPCMPARRDLHTGRMNFMHRSWGPLEPFDNSLPTLLSDVGVHSHLVTDHLHYFEDGGATYHTRFTTYDFIRGQEYDAWKPLVNPPMEKLREKYHSSQYRFGADQTATGRATKRLQHAINNEFLDNEADQPGPRCFASAFDFLDLNHEADDWFLMLECFDPHEPFRAPARFKEPYKTGWTGGVLDWPDYAKVTETAEETAEIRANYAALVAMCDHYFGQILDYLDAHDMWKDTALVVSTDHGFLLTEHDWWGKCLQPYYQELANIPLMIHDPRAPQFAGTRTDRLTQTHDLMPTFLDLHDAPVPGEVRGTSVLSQDGPSDVAVYGLFGGPIGINDGRFVLYLYPEDLTASGLYEYTLMPMHMASMFTSEELQTAQLVEGFDFTKGMRVLRIDALKNAQRVPVQDGETFQDVGTRLYDLDADPLQQVPYRDAAIEARLLRQLAEVLKEHDCPPEIYDRYGVIDFAAQGTA